VALGHELTTMKKMDDRWLRVLFAGLICLLAIPILGFGVGQVEVGLWLIAFAAAVIVWLALRKRKRSG
jgi:hypothetical protein